MAKNVYLVITDLHWYYKNLRSHFDYVAENMYVLKKIEEIALRYKQNGYSVKFLTLGDLFHQGYSDTFSAVRDNNVFIKLHDEFGEIYSVVGNHELSYYRNNPFYTLVKDIKSKKLQGIINKVWQPVGVKSVIDVVDRLDDGNVHFYFNHNSTPITTPDTDGVNIGLFHTDLISDQIKKRAEAVLGSEIFGNTLDVEGSGVFSGYKYCFLGHMHQVYGTFLTDSGTYLCYLGSLGRTNVKEVNDNFLERDIPAILVSDGELEKVESNKFDLMSRADCINESLVEIYEEQYEQIKEKQIIKSYCPVGDDPIQNVKASLGSNVLAVSIFSELLRDNVDYEGVRILREAKDFE